MVKCTHPTNEKDGLCVICRNPKKFGSGDFASPPIPASRPSKVAQKATRGFRGSNAGDTTPTNKKLKLFAKAQISYLLSLAYQGNVPVLIKRLHLLQRNLRNGKF